MENLSREEDTANVDIVHNKRHNIGVWYAIGLAAIAGLLFGVDIGVISGALPLLKIEFNLNLLMEGWIVGSLMGGAVLGALVASPISNAYGRRTALLISAVIFIVGIITAVLAKSVEILIFGRLLLGVGVGISSFSAPLYVSEIAPKEVRGRAISTFDLVISVGILVSFLCNWIFSYWENWRAMFAVLLVPALLFLVGTLIVPRSPKWLAYKGRNEEALEVLKRIRATDEIAIQEFKDIQENLILFGKNSGFKLFRTNSNFRRSVGLGISLQTFQQFTGINIILIFAPKLFELSGFVGLQIQLLTTVLLGAVKVASTLIASLLVDKVGRKPLLYYGYIVLIIGLFSLSLGLFNKIAMLSLFGLVVFILGFAFAAGPVIWTLCSEIQPLQGRDFGVGCSTLTNWIMNTFTSTYFLVAMAQFGAAETFVFLAILNSTFLLFIYFFIPETKNVPLEQIEKNLMSGQALRNLGKMS